MDIKDNYSNMDKNFAQVFPTLKLNKELSSLFSEVLVERVSTNRQKDFLRIYLKSDHLLPKESVYAVEKEIKKQLFPKINMTVKIQERFELSAQFNVKTLLDVYRESIALEISNYSHIMHTALRKADFEATEDTLHLILEDSVPVRESEAELYDILEKIIVQRCGISCKIHMTYKEVKESHHKEEDEIILRREVAEIAKRAGRLTDEVIDGLDASSMEGAELQKTDMTDAIAAAGQENSFTDGFAAQEGTKQGIKDNKKEDLIQKKEENKKPLSRSDNPDVIYGREFEEDAMPIEDIIGEIGEVVIHGKIISVDKREIRNEKTIYFFDITDFTDTMTVKIFLRNDQVPEISEPLGKGAFVKLKGMAMVDKFDGELTIGSIVGIMKIKDFTTSRMDHSVHKRVELHCHTKMSDMDGVSEAKDIVKRAYKWGHPAIAITDHGVTQSFPDANHVWEDLWRDEKKKRQEAGDENPDKDDFFKVIYGVEAYIVDDLKEIVTKQKGQDLNNTYVVFDIETTGFSCVNNQIIEIGGVKVKDGQIVDHFSEFINPHCPIPYEIVKLTSITDDMVMGADDIEAVLPRFLEFSRDCVMVAHNATFDMSFIEENARRQGLPFDVTCIDTLGLSRALLTEQAKHTLDAVAKTLKVSLENHHRAVDDAQATAEIFIKLLQMVEEKGIYTLADMNRLGEDSPEVTKKLRSYHAIMLAKNNVGRVNLYTLVSLSHLTYYNKQPKIPKSVFMKYREGIILGSACEAGELYQAIISERSDAEIARIVDFYDYLEIQPTGNNAFMIESERVRMVNSVEDIENINRKIVKLGEQFNKPVVATCDVHFLDPEDEVYRRIIMAGKGFKDADDQAPLYLRTTEEMLAEFAYLGSEKAMEVVVTNTNKIADMIDTISPVRPDKCAPVIEDSDKTLTDICYNKAKEMYGDPLPEIVEARLQRELNSIITNGFAVMYIIAQKLVWKSVEDGYLVGSRGSVGSSFVATMSGITEVNPLSPHYYCKKCHYNDFYSDDVKAYSGRAGVDMPDKNCPVCGEPLVKDGFDIPFETFLGFKGDKEPDIDLNFSGEYQSKAHKYTEVIFGAGQTYRAGTIGTLADKTAYGYIKNYYEERGIKKRGCEINRIVGGCTGIRRSTGQHPGGIVVLPVGEDINSFSPEQQPAYEMARQSGKNYFVARKMHKLYMKNPTVVEVKSITTEAVQTLYLDEADIEAIRGKRLLLVDDVISTGESIHALEVIAEAANANIVGRATVLAEGDAADRDDIVYLEPLPLFFK